MGHTWTLANPLVSHTLCGIRLTGLHQRLIKCFSPNEEEKQAKSLTSLESIRRPNNYMVALIGFNVLFDFVLSFNCRKAYLSSENHGILIRTRSQFIPAKEGIQALQLTWHWSLLEKTRPVTFFH